MRQAAWQAPGNFLDAPDCLTPNGATFVMSLAGQCDLPSVTETT